MKKSSNAGTSKKMLDIKLFEVLLLNIITLEKFFIKKNILMLREPVESQVRHSTFYIKILVL